MTGRWEKLHYEELCDVCGGENMIRGIKEEDVGRIYSTNGNKREEDKRLTRISSRWEDNTESDLKQAED